MEAREHGSPWKYSVKSTGRVEGKGWRVAVERQREDTHYSGDLLSKVTLQVSRFGESTEMDIKTPKVADSSLRKEEGS